MGWASCAAAQPDGRQSLPGGDDPTGAAAGAGARVATPLADDWRAICLSHREDFDEAGRMAEAAGWMVAPDSMVPPFEKAVGKPRLWLRSSARGLEFLAVGRMVDSPVDGGPQMRARFCGVGATPAQAGVARAVATFVSLPPNTSEAKPGRVTFVYRHTSRGLTPVLSDLKDPAAIQALQSHDVDFVQIDEGAKITILLLAVPEAAS